MKKRIIVGVILIWFSIFAGSVQNQHISVINMYSAGTACTEPASGTVLFGNYSESEADEIGGGNFCVAGYEANMNTLYTASWDASCTTATVASVKIHVREVIAGNGKAVIRDSSQNIVGVSSATAIGDSYEGATLTFSFASPPTVTKGSTYSIGFIPDTNYVISLFSTASTGYDMCYTDDGTYASPASTISLCETDSTDDGNVDWWAEH